MLATVTVSRSKRDKYVWVRCVLTVCHLSMTEDTKMNQTWLKAR